MTTCTCGRQALILSVQVTDVVAAQIAAVAASRGVTRSAFVREALEQVLTAPAAPIAPAREVRIRSRKPATDGGA
jgi:Ribbon-helix-helix protein, copG family